MAEIKTIGISTLIALGMILASSITPTFFDKPKYYCEVKPSMGMVECDSFSQYYGLPTGKCINSKLGNKLCSSGWKLVTNDLVIETDAPYGEFNGKQYLCNTEECVPK